MKAKSPLVREKRLSEKVGNVTIPIYPTSTKGYDGFTVVWYEAGKRCRKFFASLSEARGHARMVATKIENQERQVLALAPEDCRIYSDALARLRPLQISLDAAVREVVEARGIVGDYPVLEALKFWKRYHEVGIPEKRVSEVVQELVEGLKRDGASRAHLEEMERALGKFAGAFQTNIGDVTTAEINAYGS